MDRDEIINKIKGLITPEVIEKLSVVRRVETLGGMEDYLFGRNTNLNRGVKIKVLETNLKIIYIYLGLDPNVIPATKSEEWDNKEIWYYYINEVLPKINYNNIYDPQKFAKYTPQNTNISPVIKTAESSLIDE